MSIRFGGVAMNLGWRKRFLILPFLRTLPISGVKGRKLFDDKSWDCINFEMLPVYPANLLYV
jgi:hypothetical protein